MTATSPAGGPGQAAGAAGAIVTTLLAGALGGAICGFGDGVMASLAMAGSGARGPTVPSLGLGIGALAGIGLAGIFALVRGGAQALAQLSPVSRGRSGIWGFVVAASVLAAPVVVTDGLALFSGGQASKIPGHTVLTYVAMALGFGAVAAGAAGVFRLISWVQGSGVASPPRRIRLRKGLLVGAGTALGIGLFVANRVVLPRLYPWFHATLGLAIFVVAVVTARVLLVRVHAANLGGRRIKALVAIAIVAAGSVVVGWGRIARSQTQRFAVYQKSQLLSLVLGRLPIRPGVVLRATSVGRSNQANLPPLPEGPRRPDADVIIITVDALRPDHVGAYGYSRNTTPNIDALARRSVRFERAYTQAPNTSFASTTLLTGKYYPTLARLGPPDGLDTLPLLLRRYGVKTAAFYPPAVFYIAPEKLKAYADSNFQFEYVKVEFLAAEKRLGQLQEFFEEEKPGRVFLWLHLFEPHETYEKHEGHDFGSTDVDRYDSEIAYADRAIGEILGYLAQERPRAIVIVTADHGEEFDEHKARYHGTTLYEEQVRIPLIISVPGLSPQVIEGPVELVDLAPTILTLLDIPIPLRMRGHDLGPWLRTPPAPADRLWPAFAEVNDLRMVATAREKLISDDKKGLRELYDLQADPREQHNLADARPDRVAALQADMDAWLADNAALESARGAAGDALVSLPPALERARLGDVTVAADVAELLSGSEAPAVQREAARLLVTTLPPRPETRAALVAAQAGGDREIAGWAEVALARLGDESARRRLATALAAATDGVPTNQQIFAALALADHKDVVAVPTLTRAVQSCSEPVACVPFIVALGRLQDRRATAALIARLPTVVGRREVVVALGKIGDQAAVPALIERLANDEYTPVRAEAAAALAAIGGKAVEAGLERARHTEREPTVKAAIARALAAARLPRR